MTSRKLTPDPGAWYVFGGPHAYGGPELARGRIMTIDPGRSLTYVWRPDQPSATVLRPHDCPDACRRLLAFSWLSSGVVGTVSWHLEPADEAGQSTRLRLVHEGLKKQPGILRDYDIGWWDYLAALRWLGEGGP